MICQTEAMEEARAAEVMAESAVVLRNAGARFAYLYGSRASGQYRAQPGDQRGDRRRGGHRQPAAGAGLRGRDQSASTSTSAGSPHGTSPRAPDRSSASWGAVPIRWSRSP